MRLIYFKYAGKHQEIVEERPATDADVERIVGRTQVDVDLEVCGPNGEPLPPQISKPYYASTSHFKQATPGFPHHSIAFNLRHDRDIYPVVESVVYYF